jgi:hypothetical protein
VPRASLVLLSFKVTPNSMTIFTLLTFNSCPSFFRQVESAFASLRIMTTANSSGHPTSNYRPSSILNLGAAV